jgi:activating signal cointegrator 1
MTKRLPSIDIRILSVRQPYADQIIFGDKWNELRSWKTPYRGPIYIHASRWDGPRDQPTPGSGVTGALIGRVHLVDCLSEDVLAALEAHTRDRAPLAPELQPLARFFRKFSRASWQHGIGPWNWVLTEPAPLVSPYTIPGKLNLWRANLPASDLVTGPAQQRPTRPLAADYPEVRLEDLDVLTLGPPPGRISEPLYYALLDKHAGGRRLTLKFLNDFANQQGTTSDNVRQTLLNNQEFERVPGKPPEEEWWRVRQLRKRP